MTGTGTWLLIGFAIGFASITIGYRVRRTAALRQLEAQIPSLVNQGNRAVIGQYEEILAALHEAAHIELWEHELEQGVGE